MSHNALSCDSAGFIALHGNNEQEREREREREEEEEEEEGRTDGCNGNVSSQPANAKERARRSCMRREAHALTSS